MAHHDLKIDPKYIEAVIDGTKSFEIRYNDRGFQKGDTALLTMYSAASYGSVSVLVEITYVTGFEQKQNWVVFGQRVLEVGRDYKQLQPK